MAIDYYLKFCANIYHQKILRFLRHRKIYTNTTWAQKDMKMALTRREALSGKKNLLCSNCQSNTKTIGVSLRPGPSGDLVVKSKLFPRSDSVVDL